MHTAWVYILTNEHHTVLYVGMTNAISTRLWEHRTRQNPYSFTSKYNVFKLVHYEKFERITEAIRREHYIKGKTRKWKEDLVNRANPEWRDLSDEVSEAGG